MSVLIDSTVHVWYLSINRIRLVNQIMFTSTQVYFWIFLRKLVKSVMYNTGSVASWHGVRKSENIRGRLDWLLMRVGAAVFVATMGRYNFLVAKILNTYLHDVSSYSRCKLHRVKKSFVHYSVLWSWSYYTLMVKMKLTINIYHLRQTNSVPIPLF